MHAVALEAGEDPGDSASPALCGQRAGPPGRTRVFPPPALAHAHDRARQEILAERLPERRRRAAPRVVKRKMSNYGAKRTSHRDWPQPLRRPEDAIVILGA
jgi:hypothetical protein